MTIDYHHRQSRACRAAVLGGVLLAISGCGGMVEDTIDTARQFTAPGTMAGNLSVLERQHKVDDGFDAVSTEVAEVLKERDYEDIELERAEREKTYSYTVDNSTNEEEEKTVTERAIRITATTGDDRLVAFQARENHRWGFTALDVLEAVGGEHRRTLKTDGVVISVPHDRPGRLDLEETRIVFDEIERRLGS